MLLLWATLLFALLSAGSLYLATRRREGRSKYWAVAFAFALAFGFSLGSMLQDGRLVLRSRALVQEVERLQTETVLLRNELERAHRANGADAPFAQNSAPQGSGSPSAGLQGTEPRASGNRDREGSSLDAEVSATVTPIAVGSRAEARQEPQTEPAAVEAVAETVAEELADTAAESAADTEPADTTGAEPDEPSSDLGEPNEADLPAEAGVEAEVETATPGTATRNAETETLEPPASQPESPAAAPNTPQDAAEQDAQNQGAANPPTSLGETAPGDTTPAETNAADTEADAALDATDSSSDESVAEDGALPLKLPVPSPAGIVQDAAPLEPAPQPVSSEGQSPSAAQTVSPQPDAQPIVVSLEPRVPTAETATATATADAPATLEPPASRPDLSGAWVLRTETEETSYPAYQGLELTFEVTIADSGGGLTASGEKVSERLPGASERSYAPGSRTPITLEGEFLSNRLLQASFSERGANRASGGEMLLRVVSPERLEGSFSSDAGNAAGRVVLERR